MLPWLPWIAGRSSNNDCPENKQKIVEKVIGNQQIGWNSAVKGFLAREWSELALLDMHTPRCDPRAGNNRMQRIISALCQHTRRLWIARNGCLHDSTSSNHLPSTPEAIEIEYYHSRPHLLRTGDQHYCQRSLSKLLEGPSATRRRWLRKVKQLSAELTKDGTSRQSLITSFFRPVFFFFFFVQIIVVLAVSTAGTGYTVSAYRLKHGDNPIISSIFIY